MNYKETPQTILAFNTILRALNGLTGMQTDGVLDEVKRSRYLAGAIILPEGTPAQKEETPQE